MPKKIVFSILLALNVLPALAQVQTGLYPYGSFDNLGLDTIDRGSLNVHFSIPVVTKQGRGVGFQYELVYDGLVWTPVISNGGATWTPATGWGLRGQLNEGFLGYLSYSSDVMKCGATYTPYYFAYAYHDPYGVVHPFIYTYSTCTGVGTGGGPSPDGSGYSFNGTYVTSADGKQINAPVNNQTLSATIFDPNGNQITNNGNGTFEDTLGTIPLTITGSGTASSPRVFTYNTPTGTAKVAVTYKTYNVQTNFLCAVNQYNLSQDLVNTITLDDGSVYTFGYENTPGIPSAVTGRLSQLTLPQGGVITYTYIGPNNGIVCSDGTPQGITRATSTGTRTYSRSSITSSSSTTVLTDGLNNVLGFSFVMAGSPEAFYETSRAAYEGTPSGNPLLSRQTCYNNSGSPCTTTPISLPITQIDTYEALNAVQEHGSTLTYNTLGLLTSKTDYDFGGATSRGGTLRNETWAYPNSGIASLLLSDTVTDGNTLVGLTTYAYDETAGAGHGPLVTTSGLPQRLPEAGQRGNLTTVKQYFNPNLFLTTAAVYEDTGDVLSSTGPTGTSTYAYDSTHTFTTTATPPTPSSTISLPSSATHDANSGVLLTTADPNPQSTVTYRTYDPLLRPTEIDYPDGGKLIASYSPNSVGWNQYMTSGTHTNIETGQESYGRLSWVAVQNAPGSYYFNNYCYDGNGNLQYAAYRFAAPNQNNNSCSGAGDTYTYDALGRVLTTTHGDGSAINYSYNGRATKVTDENGVSRIVQVDGLGRTKAVCEISGSTLLGVAPVNCGLDISGTGFLTQYAYNTDYSRSNAQEITVTQGTQTRYFETDFLGRTTLVVQPESGVTTYSYAYSSSPGYGLTVTRVRPEENQPAGSTNTVTTTTQYDSVGRVVAVNYSDGFTPSKGFSYDTNAYWAQTATNLKGRLAVTGTGGTATWTGSLFSYDAMGRVVNIWQCAPATCGTGNQAARPLSFAYDWAGNLIQESDGVSGTIAYGRSTAGEVTSITNETFQDLPYDPPNLVSNVLNGPDGPVSYTLGNGLNVYRSYDQLGRNVQQWVCNGPAALNCSGGTAIYGTASQWKGSQMQTQSDTVLNQGITFGYGDGFNRLTSRTVTSGTLQNYTYAYDRYGNRVSQTPLQGGYTFNPTINPVNNQITTSGYTYDAAGNMLNDGVHGYQYDAEGNLVWVDGGSTAKYVYDVFNQRVHVQTASATTEYIYDYAGRRVSGWLSPNNYGNQGRIYWDGQQIGFRSSDGTNFDHQDILGTERLRTTYSGAVGATYQSLPWGDGYTAKVNNSGADQDSLHYAGLEHDAESGTEHAQFRNYASAQGRWLGPDSYLGSYDLTNPQSMNRYAYALNNPTSLLDPSGRTITCTEQNDGSSFCIDDEGNNNTDCGSDYTACAPPTNCVAYGTEGCITADNPGTATTISNNPSNVGSSVGLITKAQAYCATDVLINYGLGFIPGYNGLKLAATLAGANLNFVQNLAAGKSIVTFDNGATIKDNLQGILWGVNGLASTYNAVSQAAATGLDASDVIVKAAGTAGTIANLVNTVSAGYSLYQCKDAQ